MMSHSGIKSVAAVVALLLPACGQAVADSAVPPPPPPTNAPNPPAVKPAKPNPDDQVVCRIEEVTGSRLGGRRVCMTRREWTEQSMRAQHQFESMPSSGIAGK